jgi:putative flippase GtrA
LRELGVQFTKFAGVGAIGTLAHYAVLVAMVHLAGANPVFSSGLGAIVGAIINYLLNYTHTFRSHARHRDAAPKFIIVALVGILINLFMMYVLVAILDVYYLAAQIVATGAVLGWNFVGNRYWTFRGDLAVR